jgi:hypothetical protein
MGIGRCKRFDDHRARRLLAPSSCRRRCNRPRAVGHFELAPTWCAPFSQNNFPRLKRNDPTASRVAGQLERQPKAPRWPIRKYGKPARRGAKLTDCRTPQNSVDGCRCQPSSNVFIAAPRLVTGGSAFSESAAIHRPGSRRPLMLRLELQAYAIEVSPYSNAMASDMIESQVKCGRKSGGIGY